MGLFFTGSCCDAAHIVIFDTCCFDWRSVFWSEHTDTGSRLNKVMARTLIWWVAGLLFALWPY